MDIHFLYRERDSIKIKVVIIKNYINREFINSIMQRITRLLIKPHTFNIYKYQKNQNPYIDVEHQVTLNKVMTQHNNLESVLSNKISFVIDKSHFNLPDIVFVANGGLCLPRIPNTIILPLKRRT
jgi:N-dimethylarginine dimethylaminohydrolase